MQHIAGHKDILPTVDQEVRTTSKGRTAAKPGEADNLAAEQHQLTSSQKPSAASPSAAVKGTENADGPGSSQDQAKQKGEAIQVNLFVYVRCCAIIPCCS